MVRPGGVVAATVWDTFGGMPSQRMFWDTFAAIEPTALDRRALASVRPMTTSAELAGAVERGGLEQIVEAMLTIRMEFINGQGTLAAFLSTLPATTTEKLRSSVRAAYLCNRVDGPPQFCKRGVGCKRNCAK